MIETVAQFFRLLGFSLWIGVLAAAAVLWMFRRKK